MAASARLSGRGWPESRHPLPSPLREDPRLAYNETEWGIEKLIYLNPDPGVIPLWQPAGTEPSRGGARGWPLRHGLAAAPWARGRWPSLRPSWPRRTLSRPPASPEPLRPRGLGRLPCTAARARCDGAALGRPPVHAVTLWNDAGDMTTSLSMQPVSSFPDGRIFWRRNGVMDAYWCACRSSCPSAAWTGGSGRPGGLPPPAAAAAAALAGAWSPPSLGLRHPRPPTCVLLAVNAPV